MSRVIIHVPGIDSITINGVKSYKISEIGATYITTFYSEKYFQGVCLGIAPTSAVVEMMTDE